MPENLGKPNFEPPKDFFHNLEEAAREGENSVAVKGAEAELKKIDIGLEGKKKSRSQFPNNLSDNPKKDWMREWEEKNQ